MATTSIWAVKGWLGKVVLYIENPDKTDNPKFYRQEELTDVQTQSLSDVIDYAVRAEKTTVTPDDESAMVVRQFISGINCLPSTARDEMLAVKKRFGKEDGVIAYHGYQSFAPGEATPELAHEIGVKLAQRLWDERYQVLVATHPLWTASNTTAPKKIIMICAPCPTPFAGNITCRSSNGRKPGSQSTMGNGVQSRSSVPPGAD